MHRPDCCIHLIVYRLSYHCMQTSCVVFNGKRYEINVSLINRLTFLKVEKSSSSLRILSCCSSYQY